MQLTDVLIWVFFLSSTVSNETQTPDPLSISELQRPLLTEEKQNITPTTHSEHEKKSGERREREREREITHS